MYMWNEQEGHHTHRRKRLALKIYSVGHGDLSARDALYWGIQVVECCLHCDGDYLGTHATLQQHNKHVRSKLQTHTGGFIHA